MQKIVGEWHECFIYDLNKQYRSGPANRNKYWVPSYDLLEHLERVDKNSLQN